MPDTETLRLNDLVARAAGGVGGGVAAARTFTPTLGDRIEVEVVVGQRPMIGIQFRS